MGKIIAIANQKGGVGKTTTTINLASALAELNQKVLIIDLDPQANATIGIGVSRELVNVTTYDLFISDIKASEVIYNHLNSKLHIMPSSINLDKLAENMEKTTEDELRLYKKLLEIKQYYDYILIDCPPSLGMIIDNALFASDSIIIPVECEYFAYDALTQMVNKISQVQTMKKKYRLNLVIEGVLLTKLDNRNIFGYKIVEKVKELFPQLTYKTIISRSSHIQEAPMYGKSVLDFAYNSRGSKQYRDLAEEILLKNKEQIKNE